MNLNNNNMYQTNQQAWDEVTNWSKNQNAEQRSANRCSDRTI
jgi:hypothetical protein